MKYLSSKPFSTSAPSKEYRENFPFPDPFERRFAKEEGEPESGKIALTDHWERNVESLRRTCSAMVDSDGWVTDYSAQLEVREDGVFIRFPEDAKR